MPRQLLRDGRIVVDEWLYLAELEGATPTETSAIVLPFDTWLTEREKWLTWGGRLGVALFPVHKVEALAPDLAHFTVVAAEFPGPSDGRGYTQGRLLRERYGYTGELRAAGYVRRDQLFFLARCGFNSFQLAPDELAGAPDAMSTFSAEYQPSNDVGLMRKLQHK